MWFRSHKRGRLNMHELDEFSATIKQEAVDRGLIVFDDLPDISKLSGAIWKGNWPDYLDLAVHTRATLLYLKEWRYDYEGMIEEVVEEKTGPRSTLETEINAEAEAET